MNDARSSQSPKLLDQVRQQLRIRHRALSTEKQYVSWIRRFILFHNKQHPASMGKQHVEQFLSHLAVDRNVAASTQNQALAAVLFLYRDVLKQDFGWLDQVVRANKPKRLPVVLSEPEVSALFAHLSGVNRLIAMLLYGGGLRLKEALRLRVKDVDFQRHELVVRDGKGQKDRITLLAKAAAAPLKQHLKHVRSLHENAIQQGFGGVYLPSHSKRSRPGCSFPDCSSCSRNVNQIN